MEREPAKAAILRAAGGLTRLLFWQFSLGVEASQCLAAKALDWRNVPGAPLARVFGAVAEGKAFIYVEADDARLPRLVCAL